MTEVGVAVGSTVAVGLDAGVSVDVEAPGDGVLEESPSEPQATRKRKGVRRSRPRYFMS
jgi:hypothetical protein